MNQDKEFYSIKEICQRYSMSQSTVYNMIHSGAIPAVKFGRCWKILKDAFLKLLYDKL